MGSLTKGQVSNITKKAPGVTKVKFGLGWDQPEGGKVDLDLIVFALGADGKLVDKSHGVAFFNNTTSAGGAIVHSGDNRTGEGEGYDETVIIDLASLPSEITTVLGVAYSFPLDSGEQPTFDTVTNVQAGVLKADDESVIETFDTGALGSILGTELGTYTRNGEEWEFKAGGENISGSIDDLMAKYGYVDPAA